MGFKFFPYISRFNPHSRKGSDGDCLWNIAKMVYGFNPHSRKGSDFCIVRICRKPSVSIHTPARGVTAADNGSIASNNSFNPHSRKGSDTVWDTFRAEDFVSIHTPARGVTRKTVYIKHSRRFQSTLPQGE